MKHGSLLHLDLSVKDRTLPDRYLGRQIGKYRVIRLLGGGAFAWVYEAVDRDLEIPVALKILRPECAGQADAEARFRREAATAARLRHPNIVTVRDVGQVDGASFVAMDLLPLSLARRLELMSRLPEQEVVRVGLDVAAALAVAHAGGIVHRDIKPDNILISAQGEAVVADFGLARALSTDASVSGNQVTGTPHYFSPEQARGLELDGRSDLYSLGVTLFRAATGRLPFEGDDWYAVARQHVDTPAPSARDIIPELTEGFDQLLQRLLRKDPAERFATAVQLADALAGLSTAPVTRSVNSLSRGVSETITVPSPVTPLVAVRGNRRWRLVTVAAVVAIAAWSAWRLPALQRLLNPQPAISAQADSVRDAVPDTMPATTAIVGTPPIPTDTVKPKAVRPGASDSARRAAAAAVRTQLTVTAPDSATLYVDDVMVGRGSATIERPRAARIALRAVLAEAPVECTTARRDSVVQLRVGEKSAVTLAVRTCLGVRFTVVPNDAQVRFVSVDGNAPVTVRADTARSVLLPEGRYEMRVTAGRCTAYSDSVIVRRGLPIDSLSRSVKLNCGG